jgi:hypothetical protein
LHSTSKITSKNTHRTIIRRRHLPTALNLTTVRLVRHHSATMATSRLRHKVISMIMQGILMRLMSNPMADGLAMKGAATTRTTTSTIHGNMDISWADLDLNTDGV